MEERAEAAFSASCGANAGKNINRKRKTEREIRDLIYIYRERDEEEEGKREGRRRSHLRRKKVDEGKAAVPAVKLARHADGFQLPETEKEII